MAKKKRTKYNFSEVFDKAVNQTSKTILAIRTGTEWGKTVSIKDLPDCFHKSQLSMVVSSTEAKICVVACRRGIQDEWVAYAGYPDVRELKPIQTIELKEVTEWHCEFIKDVEAVKMLGVMLPKDVAEELFPEWDIELYSKKGRT